MQTNCDNQLSGPIELSSHDQWPRWPDVQVDWAAAFASCAQMLRNTVIKARLAKEMQIRKKRIRKNSDKMLVQKLHSQSKNNCELVRIMSLGAIIVLSVACAQQVARAQCPEKSMTSFERVGGVTIKDGSVPLRVLYQANVSSSSSSSSSNPNTPIINSLGAGATQTLTPDSITPITAECNNRCRRSRSCRAFLVDYSHHICWSVEQINPSAAGAGGVSLVRAPTPIHLAPTSERTAYFEKICLNLHALDCERAWIFERVQAYLLHGHDDKVIDDVPSRLKCQEQCLNEREFRCRSAEYDYLAMQCRLSSADRHTRPQAFRPASSNIDYFENQCVPIGNQCDAFDRFDDLDLGRAEIMRHANSSEQCQQFCTQTIKAFVCRSYTWSPLTNRCYLNSANTHMIGGVDKLIHAPGLIYYQRNDCIDLKLECDTSSMTLNLRTSEPFRGRMYVRDEPNACETLGRSSLVSSLSIPFQSQARCAIRELPSRYSSIVVVQQHPLIQRKSDRYIKLVCDFQTANKTIMSTYNVLSGPWTSTALINATSFAPKIRLRITDKFGNDVQGAKLGDELQLRIEAETESVYDMVARSVLARSGVTDESIVLIDHDGCPADYRIFPPLKKINKRTIIGRFDAFKFSSDVVVRFQVDVQFCLNSCPIPNCPLSTLDSGQSGLVLGAPTPPALFNVNAQQLPGGDIVGPGAQQTSAPNSSSHASANSSNSSSTTTTSAPLSSLSSSMSSLATLNELDSKGLVPNNGAALQDQPNSGLVTAGQQQQQQQWQQAERRVPLPVNQALDAQDASSTSIGQNFDDTNSSQQQSRHVAHHHHHHHHHHQPPPPMTAGPKHRHQFLANNRQQAPMYTGGDNSLQEQSLSGPELAAALNQAEQQRDQNAHKARRRRRSVEVMPDGPRHVPLQREIIVEVDNKKTTTTKNSDNNKENKQEHATNGQKNYVSRARHAHHAAAAAAASTSDNEQQSFKLATGIQSTNKETPKLDCTTWTTIIISMLAFCLFQLLILGVCLVMWLSKQRRTSGYVQKGSSTKLLSSGFFASPATAAATTTTIESDRRRTGEHLSVQTNFARQQHATPNAHLF